MLAALLAASPAFAAAPSMVISDGKTISLKDGGPLESLLDNMADGSGEIDTTLENTMTAVARIEADTDTEVASILAEVDSIYAWMPRQSKVTGLAGTAAADSLTCFTVTGGDVYMTSLAMILTTGAGATAELANFCIYNGAAGGVIVRIGEGKDLNALAAGVEQWFKPATAILSDSLAYNRNAASAGNPVVEIVPWRIRLAEGSVIKLILPGSGTATRMRAELNWFPTTRGAGITAAASS